MRNKCTISDRKLEGQRKLGRRRWTSEVTSLKYVKYEEFSGGFL